MSRFGPNDRPEVAGVDIEVSLWLRRCWATMTYVRAIYDLIPGPLKALAWLGVVAVARLLDLPVDLSALAQMIAR